MKNWSFGKTFLVLLFVGFFVLVGLRLYKNKESDEYGLRVSKNAILKLDIEGVILNGKKFLKNIKKYKKNDSVKAVVININSPGGAVGPSQEIYYEILRFKRETRKPVVCVSTGLMASGGYYAALACDKIVVAPGAMIGSIGVIMEFANLEKLYDWAKIQRYTITSGKFKDSGSEYRPMREDERELFQSMIDEVYTQFKETVKSSRHLTEEVVANYADGRVMTGASAVRLKFADVEGTFEDAVLVAADMAGLGTDYSVILPSKEKENWWEMLTTSQDEDDLNSVSSGNVLSADFWMSKLAKNLTQDVLKTSLMHQPLYMMPGYF